MSRGGGRKAARFLPPGPVHGASLATTAGITSVITGVLAGGLLAQSPPAGSAEGAWAAAAVGLLALAATALYTARNRVARSLDLAAAEPELAAWWGLRALAIYHAGQAAFFAAFGAAALWRLALLHGALGWVAAAIAAVAALHALTQANGYRLEALRVARAIAEPEPITLHVPVPDPR